MDLTLAYGKHFSIKLEKNYTTTRDGVTVYGDHKLGEQTGSNCGQFHWMTSEREANIILRELRCLKSKDVPKANRKGFQNIQEQQFSDDEKEAQNIKVKQFADNEKGPQNIKEHQFDNDGKKQ